VAQQSYDEEFTEYVRSKSQWLCKIAYLLCQDPHRADDLVQTSITKLYVNWRRARQVNHLDAYARTILVNTFLTEQRSGWWKRVVLNRENPEPAAPAADPDELDSALTVRAALAEIAPRQRAAIVLRYYCDLSVEEAAEALNCAPGTIKSQTARGLDALRLVLEARPTLHNGSV
jgi:RNA polymerase sigma-70 factor (sigma-E family)